MIRISIPNMLCYFVVFLSIFTADSIYLYLNYSVKLGYEFLVYIFAIACVAYTTRQDLFWCIKICLFVLIVMFIVTMFNYNRTEYLYMVLIGMRIFCALVFVVATSNLNLDLLKACKTIIVAIALFGIICFLIYEVNPLAPQPHLVKIKTSVLSEGTYYLNWRSIYYRWDMRNKIKLFGFELYRQNGFFREVGISGIFYTFAIWHEWFMEEDKRLPRSIILVLSVFLARSTMGILIFLCLLAIKLFIRDIRFIFFYIPVGISVVYTAFLVLKEKFRDVTNVAGRQDNIMNTIYKIAKHPIVGVGLYRNEGSWCGLLNYGVFFGIAGWLLVLFVIKFILRNKMITDWKARMGLIIWWVLSLMNESVGLYTFFIVLYVFLFMSYREWDNFEFEKAYNTN